MAKYNVGDKVVIRKDLVNFGTYGARNFVPTMKAMCDAHDYILTIKSVREDDVYDMEEDNTGLHFSWTNQMIEKVYTDTKFEAFLKEVADGDADYCRKTYEAWRKICDLSKGKCGDSKEETIQWLTNFYSNFVPKDEAVKKMTKAEIEAELGYEIEIVEE